MREGRHAVIAMREGGQNQGDALKRLSKDDIGALLELTRQHKVTCIRLAHENPEDKLHANELEKFKRIYQTLKIAYEQRA